MDGPTWAAISRTGRSVSFNSEWMDSELGLDLTPGWSLKLSREDTIRPSRSSIAAKSGSREVWLVEESRSTEEVSDVSEVWDWLSESSSVESGGWSDERRRDDIVALFCCILVWIYGRIDGWKDGLIDGWIDGLGFWRLIDGLIFDLIDNSNQEN